MNLHPPFKNKVILQKTVTGKDDRESSFSTLLQKSLEIGDNGPSFLDKWISRALL
jgi:hypothetical protein